MPTQPARQAAAAVDAYKTLGDMSRSFERTMADAFVKSAVQGKRFEDVLKSVGGRLQSIGMAAALRPVESLLGNAADAIIKSLAGVATGGIGSLLSGLGGGAQLGSAATTGHLSVYARGGVLDGPSMFPMQGGLGLAGEAGPEAIMPLARGADGRLGVRASGGSVHVTVNVTTPDAESFRRSEAQVTAALARAVARGQRGL